MLTTRQRYDAVADHEVFAADDYHRHEIALQQQQYCFKVGKAVMPLLVCGLLAYLAAHSLGELFYVLLQPHIGLGNVIIKRLFNLTRQADNDTFIYEIPSVQPEVYNGLFFVGVFCSLYRYYYYCFFYILTSQIQYKRFTRRRCRNENSSPARQRNDSSSPARRHQRTLKRNRRNK